MKYEGTVKVRFDDGSKHELPIYSTENFVDTEEGWKLLKEGVEKGDMTKYRAAKTAYIRKLVLEKGGYWPAWEMA